MADGFARLIVGRDPARTLRRIAILVAGAAALLTWGILPVRGEGPSMQPTIRDGELLIVSRLSYALRAPRRGEVAAVRLAGERAVLIKRILAGPGDRLSIDGGQVVVNDVPIDEPYVVHRRPWRMAELTLGAGPVLRRRRQPGDADGTAYAGDGVAAAAGRAGGVVSRSWLTRGLLAAGAAVVLYWAWGWVFTSDEARVRAAVDALATTLSTAAADPLGQVAALGTLRRQLAEDVVVATGGGAEVRGRDAVAGLWQRLRTSAGITRVRAFDVEVVVTPDGQTARPAASSR